MSKTIVESTNTLRTTDNVNYVKNGEIYSHVPMTPIMIESEADLARITSEYSAGAVAFLAGLSKMWQLSASGEWIEI